MNKSAVKQLKDNLFGTLRVVQAEKFLRELYFIKKKTP